VRSGLAVIAIWPGGWPIDPSSPSRRRMAGLGWNQVLTGCGLLLSKLIQAGRYA